jgi:hypothetical protein
MRRCPVVETRCVECDGPAAGGYIVAVAGPEPSGVLHRDEFGTAAAYYGSVTVRYVRRGCTVPGCKERPSHVQPRV